MEKNTEIENIIAKYLAGEASPEEAITLEEWKDLSSENEKYYQGCEQLFNTQNTNQQKVETNKAWENVSSQLTSQTKVVSLKRSYSAWRIAASIAILLSISVYVFYNFNSQQQDVLSYQAENEIMNVALSDSTHIQLSPHANIVLNEHFGEKNRLLKLKGDAYFEVIHNAEKPFIVDAGKVFIKDIGTKFKITNSSDSDTVHVHVDEGVVLLFDSAGTEITITANQHAMYIRSTKQVVSDAASIVPIKSVFDKTKLIDVAKILSEKYNMPITLSNNIIHNCLLTASFNNENIETVLTIISETLGFSYKKTEDGYLIFGKQCR